MITPKGCYNSNLLHSSSPMAMLLVWTSLLLLQLPSASATITIRSEWNKEVSGVYVRGVIPGHEHAFAKAATSEEGERLDLWLYSIDHGMDGVRWMVGPDITTDSALTYVDGFSRQDPCGTRDSWRVHNDGIWKPDPTFTIECPGLEPGGVDSCDSSSTNNNSSLPVPCVDLIGMGSKYPPVPMPKVMLGTAYISENHGAGAQNPEVVEPPPAIEMALDIGYQGLDLGSQMHPAYANERAVGELLALRPGRRKSVFLTTKLSPNEHGYHSTLLAVQRSLQLLRTDTIDLYLIHHPGCLMADKCEGEWPHSWRAMEKLMGLGAIRAIGVSNFDYHQIYHLLGDPASEDTHEGMARAPISLLQNRADPLALEDPNLLRLCRDHGINYQAFSVLGRQWVVGPWSEYWNAPAHPIMGHPHVEAIAKRLSSETNTKVSPAQVILRWAVEQGWTVVPKTAKKSRLDSNRQIFHFHLTELDMGILNRLKPPPKGESEL